MTSGVQRRTFLSASAASLAAVVAGAAPTKALGKKRPLVIASPNGMTTVKQVMQRIRAGADPLDAAIEGISSVQTDRNDPSIGYGGFADRDGTVELDALVMHGPTSGVGAVAGLRNILHPAAVAREVMRRTENCLLMGDGALAFAKFAGFPEVDLLTPEMKELLLLAKKVSGLFKELPAATPADSKKLDDMLSQLSWLGAIHCMALDTHGDIAGVSMNPGRFFKPPGRVGDTPIPGAGLYVDNEIGACGSTGTGELNLMNCSCYLVVENLRRGMHPKDACLAACRRVLQTAKRSPRFWSRERGLNGSVAFYCFNKAGKFGGANLGSPYEMAVHDGESARMVELAVLPIK